MKLGPGGQAQKLGWVSLELVPPVRQVDDNRPSHGQGRIVIVELRRSQGLVQPLLDVLHRGDRLIVIREPLEQVIEAGAGRIGAGLHRPVHGLGQGYGLWFGGHARSLPSRKRSGTSGGGDLRRQAGAAVRSSATTASATPTRS